MLEICNLKRGTPCWDQWVWVCCVWCGEVSWRFGQPLKRVHFLLSLFQRNFWCVCGNKKWWVAPAIHFQTRLVPPFINFIISAGISIVVAVWQTLSFAVDRSRQVVKWWHYGKFKGGVGRKLVAVSFVCSSTSSSASESLYPKCLNRRRDTKKKFHFQNSQ